VPQKRPTARDVEPSPSLRRDLLSFSSAFGEPVTAPHVVHTWPLGWTVGSIGGDALKGVVKGVTRASFGRRVPPTPQLKRASTRRREEKVFRGST